MIKSALIAWNELINKQPDIFNDKSLFLIVQMLNKNLSDEFILLCLQHLKHATLLHEINRQNIMNIGILSSLKPLLKTQNPEVSCKCAIMFPHIGNGISANAHIFILSIIGIKRDMFTV